MTRTARGATELTPKKERQKFMEGINGGLAKPPSQIQRVDMTDVV